MAHPELYQINYRIEKVGLHKIHVRLKKGNENVQRPCNPGNDGLELLTCNQYPKLIHTWSDRPSRLYSTAVATFEYCGEIKLEMVARDQFDNTLTDYGVLFNATVIYESLGENPEPEEYFADMNAEDDLAALAY